MSGDISFRGPFISRASNPGHISLRGLEGSLALSNPEILLDIINEASLVAIPTDLQVFVNVVTGSDLNDGSYLTPFASLDRAMLEVRTHGWNRTASVTIAATSPPLTLSPGVVNLDPGSIGAQLYPLVIQGAARTLIGSFVVGSATTDFQTVGNVSAGSNLIIVTPTIATGSSPGQIVRFTSGDLSNYSPGVNPPNASLAPQTVEGFIGKIGANGPVSDVTALTLAIPGDVISTPAPGDTFVIEEINTQINVGGIPVEAESVVISTGGKEVLFYNLSFTGSSVCSIYLQNIVTQFNSVQFISTDEIFVITAGPSAVMSSSTLVSQTYPNWSSLISPIVPILTAYGPNSPNSTAGLYLEALDTTSSRVLVVNQNAVANMGGIAGRGWVALNGPLNVFGAYLDQVSAANPPNVDFTGVGLPLSGGSITNLWIIGGSISIDSEVQGTVITSINLQDPDVSPILSLGVNSTLTMSNAYLHTTVAAETPVSLGAGSSCVIMGCAITGGADPDTFGGGIILGRSARAVLDGVYIYSVDRTAITCLANSDLTVNNFLTIDGAAFTQVGIDMSQENTTRLHADRIDITNCSDTGLYTGAITNINTFVATNCVGGGVNCEGGDHNITGDISVCGNGLFVNKGNVNFTGTINSNLNGVLGFGNSSILLQGGIADNANVAIFTGGDGGTDGALGSNVTLFACAVSGSILGSEIIVLGPGSSLSLMGGTSISNIAGDSNSCIVADGAKVINTSSTEVIGTIGGGGGELISLTNQASLQYNSVLNNGGSGTAISADGQCQIQLGSSVTINGGIGTMIYAVNQSNVQVTDSTLLGAGGGNPGIQLGGQSTLQMNGGSITLCGADGILASGGSNVQVLDATINDNTGNGIQLSQSNCNLVEVNGATNILSGVLLNSGSSISTDSATSISGALGPDMTVILSTGSTFNTWAVWGSGSEYLALPATNSSNTSWTRFA